MTLKLMQWAVHTLIIKCGSNDLIILYIYRSDLTLFCPFIIGNNLLEIISGKVMDLIVPYRYTIYSFNCPKTYCFYLIV